MSKGFTRESLYSETTPPSLMRLNVRGDYIQRANLTRIVDSEGNPTNQWECDSRIINKDEYNDIFASLATPSHNRLESDQMDLMDGVTDLFVAQAELEAQQMDVMEAIADIYSIISEG